MLQCRPHEAHAIIGRAGETLLGALDNLGRAVGVAADRIVILRRPITAALRPSDVIPFVILDDEAELPVRRRQLLFTEIALARGATLLLNRRGDIAPLHVRSDRAIGD